MIKTSKISARFVICLKCSFQSSFFKLFGYLVPIIFKKYILVPNFFLVLFLVEKRKEVVEFQLRKIKLLFGKILTTKRFHMTRGVKMMCFFFTLKNIFEFGKIFCLVLISILCLFLHFLKGIDWFNKVSKVFLSFSSSFFSPFLSGLERGGRQIPYQK